MEDFTDNKIIELLNETRFTTAPSQSRDEFGENKKFDVYINPTEEEYIRFIPIEARVFISKSGDMYVEGWRYSDNDAKEHISDLIHQELVEAIAPLLNLPSMHFLAIYTDLKQGLPCYMVGRDFSVMLTYMIDTDTVKEKGKYITEYMTKAKKKNPNFNFIPKRML